MIIQTIQYPDKHQMIDWTNSEILIRPFADKIKGVIDIDPLLIPYDAIIQLKKLGYRTEIKRAWIHFMDPKSDHASGHTHDHDTAVIYLQTFENSGDLLFIDEKTKLCTIRLSPKEDQMVIVPALQIHSMSENKSTGRRIAMAFPLEKENGL